MDPYFIRMLCILSYCICSFSSTSPRRKKKFIPDYLEDIRLSHPQPIFHVLVLGFSCYLIMMLSQLTGSLIYGQYSFDISRELPPNSWNLLVSINAGVFEEILMRGVILTLLLKKYSKNKSIIMSAVIFGSIHISNFLNAVFYYDLV